jgi:hypothetical protein
MTQDAFIDLLCQDDELVRTEFDAIITAAWPVPPVPPTVPAPPGSDDRPPGWPYRPGWIDLPTPAAGHLVDLRRWRDRQRSPPQTKGG